MSVMATIRPGAFLALAAVAAVVSACTVMRTDPVTATKGLTCNSRLGGYQLATSRLQIEVTKSRHKTTYEVFNILKKLDVERRPESEVYCLDYLSSPTSSDNVIVRRSDTNVAATESVFSAGVGKPIGEIAGAKPKLTSRGLLRLVASRSVDETAFVLRKLIRAAKAVYVTSKSRSSVPKPEDLAEANLDKLDSARLHIDPFNPRKMAAANARLRQFGFCLIFEDFTVDLRKQNVFNAYCNDPLGTLKQAYPTNPAVGAKISIVKPATKGIYYRPRRSYKVYVLAKDDPEAPGPWIPVHSKVVEMENLSPILSVGIDRAVFAKRQTALVFEDGALTDICITKESELQGAIDIPIELVSAIVTAPIDALRASTERAALRKQLIETETRLIEVQDAHIAYEKDENEKLILSQSAGNLIETGAAKDVSNGSLFTTDDLAPDAFLQDSGITRNERIFQLCGNLFSDADFAAAGLE